MSASGCSNPSSCLTRRRFAGLEIATSLEESNAAGVFYSGETCGLEDVSADACPASAGSADGDRGSLAVARVEKDDRQARSMRAWEQSLGPRGDGMRMTVPLREPTQTRTVSLYEAADRLVTIVC
jgi:hypothetical protein